jgi:hypothetical protein
MRIAPMAPLCRSCPCRTRCRTSVPCWISCAPPWALRTTHSSECFQGCRRVCRLVPQPNGLRARCAASAARCRASVLQCDAAKPTPHVTAAPCFAHSLRSLQLFLWRFSRAQSGVVPRSLLHHLIFPERWQVGAGQAGLGLRAGACKLHCTGWRCSGPAAASARNTDVRLPRCHPPRCPCNTQFSCRVSARGNRRMVTLRLAASTVWLSRLRAKPKVARAGAAHQLERAPRTQKPRRQHFRCRPGSPPRR